MLGKKVHDDRGIGADLGRSEKAKGPFRGRVNSTIHSVLPEARTSNAKKVDSQDERRKKSQEKKKKLIAKPDHVLRPHSLHQAPNPPSLHGDELWLTAACKVSSNKHEGGMMYSILHYERKRERTRRRRETMQMMHQQMLFDFRMEDAFWSPSPSQPKKLRFCRFTKEHRYHLNEPIIQAEDVSLPPSPPDAPNIP